VELTMTLRLWLPMVSVPVSLWRLPLPPISLMLLKTMCSMPRRPGAGTVWACEK